MLLPFPPSTHFRLRYLSTSKEVSMTAMDLEHKKTKTLLIRTQVLRSSGAVIPSNVESHDSLPVFHPSARLNGVGESFFVSNILPSYAHDGVRSSEEKYVLIGKLYPGRLNRPYLNATCGGSPFSKHCPGLCFGHGLSGGTMSEVLIGKKHFGIQKRRYSISRP